MYGETFYGRHTAQHQLQWNQIKIRNEILKSNENIHKKEVGAHLSSGSSGMIHPGCIG